MDSAEPGEDGTKLHTNGGWHVHPPAGQPFTQISENYPKGLGAFYYGVSLGAGLIIGAGGVAGAFVAIVKILQTLKVVS